MKARYSSKLVPLMAAFVLSAGMTSAQQDDGPILHPKPKPKPPATATLMVLCDLACNWKLDGEVKGSIEAGGLAKMDVKLGQHLASAETLDGLDKVENEVEIKAPLQTIVRLALTPVRDARLKAEQEARDDETRKQRQKEQQRAAIARLVWTDTETGLMWPKKDNFSHVNWQQATDYCRNLRLAGLSGWRLPEIEELQGIYDINVDLNGRHIKGKIATLAAEWSSSIKNPTGEAWTFDFIDGSRVPTPLGGTHYENVLCVRRAGE